MITILRTVIGAGLSLAGILGALWCMVTLRPGLAFVASVAGQVLAALILPDDAGEQSAR